MRTVKVSLTLEEKLVAEAREIVGARGLSGYVNRALRQQLQHDRLAGLLRQPGGWEGKVKISDDFDAHLPQDLQAAFEGNG